MSSLLASPDPSVLDRAGAVLMAACEERLWAQSDAEVVSRVAAALRFRAQADAVLLAAVGEVEARGLARSRGATSTQAWLHGAHNVDPSEAGKLVRTGRSLRRGFAATAVAMAAGDVSLTQARVIIRSVEELPDDLGPGVAASGEAMMIGHCETFAPTLLALIGRRLAECVDPDGTQARDEKKFLEREVTARKKRAFTIIPDKNGSGRFLRGYADAEGAAIIAAALDALSAPIAASAAGQKDMRTAAQRRHDAFAELCRRQLAAGELPSTGGIKPRVVITIPAQSLEDRTGAGRLNDGFQISPSLARYFGCDAEIIPCFLDRNGNLIDLGRAQRLFTCARPITFSAGTGAGGLTRATVYFFAAFTTARSNAETGRSSSATAEPGSGHQRGSIHNEDPCSTPCTTHHRSNLLAGRRSGSPRRAGCFRRPH
jgi:hypothetical protein